MAYDAHKNFAYSLVATAPSPATSGTSLVVTASDGTKFPAVPFNATIWPVSAIPTTANSEIVRVTARSTDTLTITRAQESTSARTVIVGDQIAATVTAQTVTDVEGGVPVGAIHMYGGTSAPTGFLLCDGSAVSRTTYAALFTAISTNFGVGDGSTTFNVPDCRGRVPAGYAASGGHADVATMGNNDGVAAANRRPKHNHTNSVTASTGTESADHTHTGSGTTGTVSADHAHITSGTTSGISADHSHGAWSDEARHLIGSTGGSGSDYSDATDWGDGGYGTGGVSDDHSHNWDAWSGGIDTNHTHSYSFTSSGISANHTHTVTVGGTIGPSGTNPNDAPAYVVVNYIIKT